MSARLGRAAVFLRGNAATSHRGGRFLVGVCPRRHFSAGRSVALPAGRANEFSRVSSRCRKGGHGGGAIGKAGIDRCIFPCTDFAGAAELFFCGRHARGGQVVAGHRLHAGGRPCAGGNPAVPAGRFFQIHAEGGAGLFGCRPSKCGKKRWRTAQIHQVGWKPLGADQSQGLRSPLQGPNAAPNSSLRSIRTPAGRDGQSGKVQSGAARHRLDATSLPLAYGGGSRVGRSAFTLSGQTCRTIRRSRDVGRR